MEDITIHESVVKEEFNRTTEKAHVIACWIGIVLNLVWFLGDYLSIPEYWIPFLNFRIVVSVISLIALMAKNYFKISIYTCIFILVLGISVQNAYMWSVMDIPHLQKHAFAYMVLFIGVGMLVYGK
jgi:sigma-B regulation protein RsbU (phosphoserine phosphatase)